MNIFELFTWSYDDGQYRIFLTHSNKTKTQFLEDVISCSKTASERLLAGINYRDFFIESDDIMEETKNLMISFLLYEELKITNRICIGENTIIGKKENNLVKLIGKDMIKKICKRNDSLGWPTENKHFFEFYKLYNKWNYVTKFSSSLRNEESQEYIKLKEMGVSIVPYLIDELANDESNPWHALFLIIDIVNDFPELKKEDDGKIDMLSKTILEWWEIHKNEDRFKSTNVKSE